MTPEILNEPLIFAAIIFIMSVLDELLGYVARILYWHGHHRYFTYTNIGRPTSFGKNICRWLIKLAIPIIVILIFILARSSGKKEVIALYQVFCGFTFFNYLIINIRHMENILIYRLTMTGDRQVKMRDLEGEVIIGRRFSLRQSSIQILGICILFFGILIFFPSYFILGGFLAPAFISIRNLVLSGTSYPKLF
jgi:hypothetical protein